jgi:phosphoglycolate phosphatase
LRMALIIFDFDGVLANTLDDMLLFGQEVCDELGVKHTVIKTDLSNLEVMSFATYGRACEVPEHLLDEFVQRCLKRFAGKTSPPQIFDGLGDIVRQLAVDHKIAVITSNSSPVVNAFLSEHGLDACVDVVYGVEYPGSKAHKIIKVRQQLTAGAGQAPVFMVGDSLSDMYAAKEAGVISIAVTWGHQSLSLLRQGDPDYVIDSPRQLIELVEQMG